ncbi:MAG: restriction endonuclease subunit S [Bacteroidetes bacterium HGW-Bacteroidetes-1]|nr:MAG: restriction endonuclease subunit S [Bacteroidetes bacterium HGW-Bacteroidetes-1]
MKHWKSVELGNHCEVFSGFPFESLKFTSDSEDIHLVKGENLHQGYIDWEKAKRWNLAEWGELSKYQLRTNDIVVAMDRPWIEAGLKWSSISRNDPKALLVQRVACLRAKSNLSQFFLKHTIASYLFSNYLRLIATGINVPHISLKQIQKFNLLLPPLPIQRKIAAVLLAYDDLIENNNRRIAILEKMAEELYREWFVRLRFPGHEKTKIIKGLPEGWELPIVDKTFDFLGGGTPSTSIANYWQEGTIDWYSPTDLTASEAIFSFGSKQKITDEGLKRSSARLFPAYSIMLTSRATIGQISINTTPATTNQGFITCIPNKKASLYYLFYWLKLNKDYFVQLSNGATFLELTKGRFKKINILIPAHFILKQFESKIQPIFSAIEKLLLTNDKLKLSRDKLLSRLMSGKIDLDNLDIQFPASMQEDE